MFDKSDRMCFLNIMSNNKTELANVLSKTVETTEDVNNTSLKNQKLADAIASLAENIVPVIVPEIADLRSGITEELYSADEAKVNLIHAKNIVIDLDLAHEALNGIKDFSFRLGNDRLFYCLHPNRRDEIASARGLNKKWPYTKFKNDERPVKRIIYKNEETRNIINSLGKQISKKVDAVVHDSKLDCSVELYRNRIDKSFNVQDLRDGSKMAMLLVLTNNDVKHQFQTGLHDIKSLF